MHTLGEIRACLKVLPRKTRAMRAVRNAERRVREADIHAAFPETFHALIDDIQLDLGDIHNMIHRTWFEPGPR
jgi:uncharacterized alpha-E superfamily protein